MSYLAITTSNRDYGAADSMLQSPNSKAKGKGSSWIFKSVTKGCQISLKKGISISNRGPSVRGSMVGPSVRGFSGWLWF